MNLYANLSKSGQTIFISAGDTPPELHEQGVPKKALVGTLSPVNSLRESDISEISELLDLRPGEAPVAIRLERKSAPAPLGLAASRHLQHIQKSTEKVQADLAAQA